MNSTKNNKFILYSLILGFLGFFVATYLTILHYKNIIPPCSITTGCETVLNSKYAVIFGVPVSLLGSLFYLTIIILCVLLLTHYKQVFLKLFYIATVLGFIFSITLIGIQAFLIHAFCQYCLTSEAISTGILMLAYLKFRKDKQKEA